MPSKITKQYVCQWDVEPFHQTCKHCGRMQRFEFSVSDELWQRSTGGYPYCLCIECWLERCDEAGIERIELNDFRFLGIVGNTVGGTLVR